jgi:hypothetical protein
MKIHWHQLTNRVVSQCEVLGNGQGEFVDLGACNLRTCVDHPSFSSQTIWDDHMVSRMDESTLLPAYRPIIVYILRVQLKTYDRNVVLPVRLTRQLI